MKQSEERTSRNGVDLNRLVSVRGCGRPLYFDDDEWTCGRMDKPRNYRYCDKCDPINGVKYQEQFDYEK